MEENEKHTEKRNKNISSFSHLLLLVVALSSVLLLLVHILHY